jgi:phosphate transport system substrate-binding protein
VREITEIKVGFDGIVLANSKKAAGYSFTEKQIWTALAKQVPVGGKLVANPYQTWNDVDPSLPARRSRSWARRRPPARATPSSSW